MYGVEINDKYAYFLSQHTSIFLGGIAAISWLLRDIEPGVSAKKAHPRFGGYEYAWRDHHHCMQRLQESLLALAGATLHSSFHYRYSVFVQVRRQR